MNHTKLLEKHIQWKTKRESLLNDAILKYGTSEYVLRRIFGTLNSKRLSSILSGTFMDQSWFKSRPMRPAIDSCLKNTKFNRQSFDLMAKPIDKNAKEKQILRNAIERDRKVFEQIKEKSS